MCFSCHSDRVDHIRRCFNPNYGALTFKNALRHGSIIPKLFNTSQIFRTWFFSFAFSKSKFNLILCAMCIIFVEHLKKLIVRCLCNLQCTAPISTIRHAFNGSMITVQTICNNHHEYSCRSQPVVNKFSLSHVMLSAAILLAGNTFHTISKIAEVSGIKLFSKRTFY